MLRFLSVEEMEGLTGFKRPAAQRKWLADQGFPFADGGDGQPKVLEEEVLQRLGGQQKKMRREPQLRP